MNSVSVISIETDRSGDSVWGSVSIDLVPTAYAPPAPPFGVSSPMSAERVVWFSVPAGWSGDWHPSPRHQLYVQTGGCLEVTTGDGASRQLRAGSVIWLRDTTGRGHRSKAIGDKPATGLFIHLPPEERAR